MVADDLGKNVDTNFKHREVAKTSLENLYKKMLADSDNIQDGNIVAYDISKYVDANAMLQLSRTSSEGWFERMLGQSNNMQEAKIVADYMGKDVDASTKIELARTSSEDCVCKMLADLGNK